jgi:ATPase subunit of ABC transporter with duplicated ATPase domains
MPAYQYVYHLDGLTKIYPGGKKVFENIRLHFYPDAKIGVVGVNGSGKSTLLRIMAGEDKDFSARPRPPTASRSATCRRSRSSIRLKNVFENIAAKCPEKMMVDEFNAISVKLGEEYTDELMEQMTKLQEEIDAANAWDIDAKIEMAMDALRCPPGDADVESCRAARSAASRSARCCCPSPTCC